MEIVRSIVEHLETAPGETIRVMPSEPPAYDPDELLGIVPENNNQSFDVREVVRVRVRVRVRLRVRVRVGGLREF